MNIKHPMLVPIIGHGATNIIDFPIQTLLLNLLSGLFVYNLNTIQRKILLVFFSIFHISEDIPNKIFYKSKILHIKKFKYILSSLIHGLWIKYPIISKIHLLFFHTPLHYIKIIHMKSQVKLKLLLGTSISLISIHFLNKNYDKNFQKKFGELWWIFPILPHIILTHKTYINFINNKKKYYQYININKYIGNYVTHI